MNFTILSSALLKELSNLSRVIISNPVVPILDNFLFEIKEDSLTITASDLQTSVIATLAIKASEQGAIAVPARILMETLKCLPAQPLTFAIDTSTYSLTITSANGQYKLACENAADFPQVPESRNNKGLQMPAVVLKKAIEQTIFATSKDDLRPVLAGVHICMDKETTTFIATDGHRLARYIRTDIKVPHQHIFTVPTKPLQLLVQLLGSFKESVDITIGQDSIYFSLDHTRLITRLINGEYPDYENVIPKKNPYKLTTNTSACLKALKTVDIYANRNTHQIKMTPSVNSLKISTEDLDFSNEAKEVLSCVYEGKNMEIGFNAKFLIEMLHVIPTEELSMHFDTPNTAALLVPEATENHEDLLLLIMPVLLKETIQ